MVDDFEDYADLNGGATATTIRDAADSPSTHASTLQSLVDDLADDSTQIRANVEGDIADATTMNLQPASTAARQLTQSGLFGVGLLNSFADTVEASTKRSRRSTPSFTTRPTPAGRRNRAPRATTARPAAPTTTAMT